MADRRMSARVSATVAAVVLLGIASHAAAARILVSGNSLDPGNPSLQGVIAGLGHTAVFVDPVNFAGTSFVGFDAVWLDGFSQYGPEAWPAHLLAFLNAGGNVLVQNPGFGSEPLSAYPLGAQLAAQSTFPPGENAIVIVDALSPLGANHALSAGLTDAGLSQWGPAAFGYFGTIGAFSGVTTTGSGGQWVTIVAGVGPGYLVYTQQGVSQYLSSAANPGPTSEAARFLDNVVTLAPLPPLCDIQLNKTTFVNGEDVVAQVARLANPGPHPVPLEVTVWIEVPGEPPIPFLTGGGDGSFVVAPGFDKDFGPLPFGVVQAAYPRGPYRVNCRLSHAVTGIFLGEDANPFQIQ